MDEDGDPDNVEKRLSMDQSYQEIYEDKPKRLAKIKEFLSDMSIGQY